MKGGGGAGGKRRDLQTKNPPHKSDVLKGPVRMGRKKKEE